VQLHRVLSTICLARYGLAVPPALKLHDRLCQGCIGNECGADESPQISSTSQTLSHFPFIWFHLHLSLTTHTKLLHCLILPSNAEVTLQFVRLVITTPGVRTQSHLKPCSRLSLPRSTLIRKLIPLTMGRTPWGFPGKYTSNAKSTEPADEEYAYRPIRHQSTSSS